VARSFVDLGRSPLANSFLSRDDLKRMEAPFYPLHAYVCDSCLVQLEEYESAVNIFGNYLLFSIRNYGCVIVAPTPKRWLRGTARRLVAEGYRGGQQCAGPCHGLSEPDASSGRLYPTDSANLVS
jgi:hypothetical protein